MLDHFTLSVTDLPKALEFYEKALGPLGISLQMSFEQYRGLGSNGKPFFWVKHAEVPTTPMHLAFAAPSRAAVDAFHAAAVAAGAKDDGPPGLRTHYHPTYYAAFVIDPMGHPLEAVCHAEPAAAKAAPRVQRSSRQAKPSKKASAKKAAPKKSAPKKAAPKKRSRR